MAASERVRPFPFAPKPQVFTDELLDNISYLSVQNFVAKFSVVCYSGTEHTNFLIYQLFYQCINAETEGELDMILASTKSKGIMKAVREIRILNLRKRIRYEYRMWQKAKRDRRAEDAYVRDEGRTEGIEIGMIKGDEARKTAVVRNMLAQGMEFS